MSFLSSIAEYVAQETILTLDTDLFIGSDVYSVPNRAVTLQEVDGDENESGLIVTYVDVIAKELSYEAAKTLIYLVFDLLAHKAGYSGVSDVLYCDVGSAPRYADRDDRCFYFTCNLIFRRK